VLECSITILLVWGVLTFGAVYPWAYWPLAMFSIVVGVTAVMTAAPTAAERRLLVVPLAAFAIAVMLQLVPLSRGVLSALSPHAADVMERLDPAFSNGLRATHPLSIAPRSTGVGLVLWIAFAALALGSMHLFGRIGPSRVIGAMAMTGAAVALIGIVQAPLYTGRIYGFWKPIFEASPYGPFVNKNHFAGWMLLCIPIAVGAFAGGMSTAMRTVRPTWRDRLLWWSTPAASQLALLAAAVTLMMLSVVLSMSRSGMLALMAALTVIGVFTVTSSMNWTRRILVGVFLSIAVIVVIMSVGLATMAARFAATDAKQYNTRKGAWIDALSISRLFPLTGTGFNTYGFATLVYQKHDLAHHYAEAHNDYLQFSAEGGLLLTVPAVVCAVAAATLIVKRFKSDVRRDSYWLRAGAVAAIVGIGLQEVVDFSLQMPGNAALMAIVCAIALHREPSERPLAVRATAL